MGIVCTPGTTPPPRSEPPQWSSKALVNLKTLLKACPGGSDTKLYGLIDAAADRTLYERLLSEPVASTVTCLFEGDPALRYRNVAPYLITINKASPISHDWLNGEWTNHWGIWLSTEQPLSLLKAHLKKFLFVQTPRSQKALFRFYDPRVLGQVMPIMTPGQRGDIFGLNYKHMPDALYAVVPNGARTVLQRFTPKQNFLVRLANASLFHVDELPWQ
jgi:hypothetical protein